MRMTPLKHLVRAVAGIGAAVAVNATLLVSPSQANNADLNQLRVLTYNLCMSNAATPCSDVYRLSLTNQQRLTRTNTYVVHRDDSSKKPDVIALQEVAYSEVGGEAALLEKFPGYALAERSTWRWILYNTATLTKLDSGAAAVNASGKAFPWARFERKNAPANKVTVVNVHLANDDAPRAAEISYLDNTLSSELGTRTVFAGDFNAYDSALGAFKTAFQPETGALADTNTETRRTATPKYPVAGRTYPYNPVFTVSGYANLRPVDHIYAGSGLSKVSSEIYKDLGEPGGLVNDEAADEARWDAVRGRRSDHNAVYSVLSW